MNIKYVNNMHQEVGLNSGSYKMLISDILNHEWEPEELGNRIAGFQKGISKKTVNIDVIKNSRESSRALANKLIEFFERDVRKASPGKLYIGEYYLPCYIYSAVKTNWGTDVVMSCEFGVITDYPFWCRERLFSFRKDAGAQSDFLDYPHGYPYDYCAPSNMRFLNNDHYYGCDFMCTVYGPCESPRFMINDHIYEVRTVLYDSERLTFDSRGKSLVKTDYQGREINIFNSRNKEHSLFQKMPPGRSSVTWNMGFDFDITLFQERSEPEWK